MIYDNIFTGHQLASAKRRNEDHKKLLLVFPATLCSLSSFLLDLVNFLNDFAHFWQFLEEFKETFQIRGFFKNRYIIGDEY